MKKFLKVLEWTGTGILAVIVLLTVFMVLAPKFGLQMHSVMSGSMKPTMETGGLVICRSTAIEDLKVGDIVGFRTDGGKEVTHRIIDIQEKDGQLWFQTKGDANADPDLEPVTPTQPKVDRVVYHVPYLGFIAVFLKGKMAFFLLIAIPALVLLFLLGKDLLAGIREVKEERRPKRGKPPYNRGAIVDKVVPQSPADKAGLEPGDVIVSIDGTPLSSMAQFIYELRHRKAGDIVTIGHYRGRKKKWSTTVLERKPQGEA
jgi:signal peptidase